MTYLKLQVSEWGVGIPDPFDQIYKSVLLIQQSGCFPGVGCFLDFWIKKFKIIYIHFLV